MAYANGNGGATSRVHSSTENESQNGTPSALVPTPTAVDAAFEHGLSFGDVKHTSAPSPVEAPDLQLEASIAEAGEHSEHTSEEPESTLLQALRGEAFPPPIQDEWFDPPPAGSFDAGIARVMGEQFVADFDQWVRGRGLKIVDRLKDVTKDLMAEVKRSYGFSRYAVLLINAVVNEEGDDRRTHRKAVEYELSRMAATAYLAGWYMGSEHVDADLRRFRTEEIAKACKKPTDGQDGAR